MRLCVYIIWTLVAAGACLVSAAPASTNAQVVSVFTLPSAPSEGRDPFYPNSTRPYQYVTVRHAVELTSLQIKGFSEIGGRRYVIINNHTFGEGDEGDVTTADGRIHIRCLSVGADSVLIESGGAQHVLRFSDQQ